MGREDGKDFEYSIKLMNREEQRAQILRIPEMFIGRKWDADGLYFLLFGIMKLAVEPEKSNQCSELKIMLESETTVSIHDDGRGLPVESIRIVKSVERPKIEHVFTFIITRHPSPAYYAEFGFLDYFATLLSAVSEQVKIETYFEGQGYEMTCARYEIIDHLRPVDPTGIQGIQKGTWLTFTPDPAVFPDFKFDFVSLETRLRELKREFPEVRMTLADKIANREIEIKTG